MQRRAGIALWSRIAEQLTASIRAGHALPGTRLPTEAALARDFQVNRHTIRRALDELARARLIRTEHGRGSFVAETVFEYEITRRPRFSEWVRRHNREPEGEMLGLGEIDLSTIAEAEVIAEALDLAPQEKVIALERLGKADARPLALARHFFPAARLPGLLAALASEPGITAALCRVGIADYVRKRSRIGSRMPSRREADLLRLAEDIPLLACENLNTTPDGTPTEICFVVYPASRVELVVEPGSAEGNAAPPTK